jgi:DNA-binding Lrp family transcriptional regulator
MPFQLDDYDVSILKSLLKDGRKSFRKVSRETGITTPTVKARFCRLVNVGFIKSVSPVFDFDTVEEGKIGQLERNNKSHGFGEIKQEAKNDKGTMTKNRHNQHEQQIEQQLQDVRFRIKKGMKIKLDCEFCKGPIAGNPHVFKFAIYERFFCCTGCMYGYKKKYAGRIQSIKRKYEGRE